MVFIFIRLGHYYKTECVLGYLRLKASTYQYKIQKKREEHRKRLGGYGREINARFREGGIIKKISEL